MIRKLCCILVSFLLGVVFIVPVKIKADSPPSDYNGRYFVATDSYYTFGKTDNGYNYQLKRNSNNPIESEQRVVIYGYPEANNNGYWNLFVYCFSDVMNKGCVINIQNYRTITISII